MSIHCPECTPDTACGNGHVYAIELAQEAAPDVALPIVYVGSTNKTVEQRMADNHRRQDDGRYRYRSPGVRKVREHFVRLRPDLYADRNPVDANTDLRRVHERALALTLRLRGFHVLSDALSE